MSRILGKALTCESAPVLVGKISCERCESSQLDIFWGTPSSALVLTGRSRRCADCGLYIPKNFFALFPLADFCPTCVRHGRIDDSRITRAKRTGSLGDALRSMASWFRGDEVEKLSWLRRAVKAGDEFACCTLADLLSRSTKPEELAAIRELYRKAAASISDDWWVGYAQHRLAWMLIAGRGGDQDVENGIRLMEAAGKRGASYAYKDLGYFFLDGTRVARDLQRAFECYSAAVALGEPSTVTHFVLWIMCRRSIGTAPDLNRARNHLEKAALLRRASNPSYDSDALVKELDEVESSAKVAAIHYPLARAFLDHLAELRTPFASELLDRCGGPHQRRASQEDYLFLSKLKLRKKNGPTDIWHLKSTSRDQLGQSSWLGQVEKAGGDVWIATTSDGEPLSEDFCALRDAALALARRLRYSQPLRH